MFHFEMLFNNSAVPDTAGRDFVSGQIQGQFNTDIKWRIDECIPAHQEFSDMSDQLVTALGTTAWGDVALLEKEMEQMFRADVKAVWTVCDKTVQDTFIQVNNYYKSFFSMEDWHDQVKKNYSDNKHEITGFLEQMTKAWDGEKYYEAGQLSGLVNTYLFYMPDPVPVPDPPSVVPAYAGTDLISGILFGQFYYDVKAGLDACYPENQLLADDGDHFMRAAKAGDWESIKTTSHDIYEEFFSSWADARDGCDETTRSAVDEVGQFFTEFAEIENWLDMMEKNRETYLIIIEQYAQQMVKAWDGAKYYEAGNLFGLIDTYLFYQP